MKVIYALWLRQLKRYTRSKARIIGSIGQPLLYLLAFGFGFGPIFAKAGNGNYIQFLSAGVISMSVLFTAVFTGIEVISDRQFGFLKETLVAPVSRTYIMIGRTLGGATVAAIQGVIVFVLTIIFGLRPEIGFNLVVGFVFMLLVAVVFTSIGTALACTLNDMQAFPLIINFLVMPMFFLSGSIFPLDGLSTTFKFLAAIDPMSYGIDGLRHSLINSPSHYGLGLDFAVLAGVSVLFLILGSYLFSKIEV